MRLLLIVPLVLAAACGKTSGGGDSSSASGSTVPPEARIEAQKIFETRCTPCHGSTGKGDGTASASLSPKPRNLTDKAWQTSVTDDHIEKIIQYGGGAVGMSAAMPANPDLQSKPAVVQALRERIRSFGKR
jgi:mono/diheme cytochrome c family protein